MKFNTKFVALNLILLKSSMTLASLPIALETISEDYRYLFLSETQSDGPDILQILQDGKRDEALQAIEKMDPKSINKLLKIPTSKRETITTTSLHIATARGMIDTAAALIAKGADDLQVDGHGNSYIEVRLDCYSIQEIKKLTQKSNLI